eukprot:1704247-Pleurochrysis_carterae.AAC.1
MLRFGSLEHRRVAGDGNCPYYAYIAGCDVFGVRDYCLRHQPADTKKPINALHPDHKRQYFLQRYVCRGLAACAYGLTLCRQLLNGTSTKTWYWNPEMCQKLPACRKECMCDCRDTKGIVPNIKDTTWGWELTLHSLAVLDNVDVVIIN